MGLTILLYNIITDKNIQYNSENCNIIDPQNFQDIQLQSDNFEMPKRINRRGRPKEQISQC